MSNFGFKKMRQAICLLVLILWRSHRARGFHPSFLSEDEINHSRVEREGAPPCNEDDLMNFLAEIQVINPESIVKLATLNDLVPSCNRVSQNLEKVKKYLQSCTPPTQPDLYTQLIKGVESLHAKICEESPFRKKFEPIHKCLHELRNDLEDCSGPADWNENSDNAAVCKAYKAIADCYYIKTATVCGKNAAATTKELLQAIIDSILTISCKEVKHNPPVRDPMPEEYMKKQSSKSEKVQAPLKLAAALLVITLIILCRSSMSN